ncbi:MAG TPA: hypothetical protein VGH27_03560 [Streptosporangiaceae bacterium]|jgi:hypothetical protein
MFPRWVSGPRPRAIRPGLVTILTAASAALLALSAGSGAQAATTTGGTWGKATLLPGIAALNSGAAELTHLSCGSPGNCAAAGYYTYGSQHQQAFVASQVDGQWQAAEPVPGISALGHGGRSFEPDYLYAVSCTRSGYCVAVGDYLQKGVGDEAFLVSAVNGAWGKAEEVPGTADLNQGGDAYLSAVSCSAAGNCSAGGGYTDAGDYGQAFVVSERDGIWQDAQQVPGVTAGPFDGTDPEIDSISCSSAGNCGTNGDIDSPEMAFVVSEQHGRWHQARLVPGLAGLNTGGFAEIDGVSCASAGSCGVGGFYWHHGAKDASYYHAFVASEAGGTWGRAAEVSGFAAFHGRNAIISSLSCGSPGNCSAVGNSGYTTQYNQGFVVTEQDGVWGAAQLAPGLPRMPAGKGNVQFNGISCGAPGDCSAAGSYDTPGRPSHAFVIGQAGGTWGAAEQVPGTALLAGAGGSSGGALSCASAGHCSAAGMIYPEGSNQDEIFVVSET